jgi:uncharacterized protein (DUF111 family)
MPGGFESDEVYRIETNLDDCPAEVLGAVLEQLFGAGALDVWFTPIQMKKHRPGVMLSVLCEEGIRDAVCDLILTETTAFGVRVERIHRLKLSRRQEMVETAFGQVVVKLGLKGERVVQIAPEFESCRDVAEVAGVPLREVNEAARVAWRAQNSQADTTEG